MQQYFVDTPLCLDTPLLMNEKQCHHIIHVMRMRQNECIRVADDSGTIMIAHIQIKGKEVWANPFETLPAAALAGEVTLIMGLIKGDRWELVLQKAAELGATRIVPISTRYSVVKVTKEKMDKKMQRWQSIATEASEQCERSTICKVEEPITFDELNDYKSDLNIIAYERADVRSLHISRLLKQHPFRSVSVLIGCEGGFAIEEVKQAEEYGFSRVSLGPLILRAETAAMAALSNISYELEARDLK